MKYTLIKFTLQFKRICAYHWLETLTTEELWTLNAMICHLVWIIYRRSGLVKRAKDGRIIVVGDLSKVKIDKVYCATTGMIKYMEQYWKGKACCDRKIIIAKYKEMLRQHGLINWVERKFSDGKRAPTMYININPVNLLIVAEQIERILLDRAYEDNEIRIKGDLRYLPQHKSYAMVTLFNAVFKGVSVWRRVDPNWAEVMPVFDVAEDAIASFDAYFFGDRNPIAMQT